MSMLACAGQVLQLFKHVHMQIDSRVASCRSLCGSNRTPEAASAVLYRLCYLHLLVCRLVPSALLFQCIIYDTTVLYFFTFPSVPPHPHTHTCAFLVVAGGLYSPELALIGSIGVYFFVVGAWASLYVYTPEVCIKFCYS